MGVGYERASKRRWSRRRAILEALLGLLLLVGACFVLMPDAPVAAAAADARVAASASCATLARIDRTATNGSAWGKTILAGGGASGGWFGVDVCANGTNSVAPNGSSVSCDAVPTSWSKSGCAPGSPTSDGYGWTFQCPELVVRFSAWAFNDSPGDWGNGSGGNAPDLWLAANHPSDFVMYRNGSTHAPVPGDILVWGYLDANGNPWPAGPNGAHGGHIAVVAAVRDGMVITAEQNVKWGSVDHPSDSLALTKSGDRWILSGTTAPTTKLPTYRWPSTMGHSRATFGWLHSTKNTGQFPSKSSGKAPVSGSASGAPSADSPSQQTPGGMPSLSAATAITSDGQLVDLAWAAQSPFAPAAAATAPHAQLRNLTGPPGVSLVPGQTPATVLTTDGARYTYALGADGHVYLARTEPDVFGVFWSDLGAPAGVQLTGSARATLFAGGIAIAAAGQDGNLYWRAGPVGSSSGGWSSLGKPDAGLTAQFALAGSPGVGTPLLLALGADGVLYERLWQEAVTTVDGATELPAGWSGWLAVGGQPGGVTFGGALLVVPELPASNRLIGPWADSPLNVFTLDARGALWWLRSTRLADGWHATQVAATVPFTSLLDGVAVAPAQTTTATPAQSATTATIALYAANHDATYTAALPIPSSVNADASTSATATPTTTPTTTTTPTPTATPPTWTPLPALPPAQAATTPQSVALSLAPAESVLLVAAGDTLLLGGASDATATALPGGKPAQGTPASTKNPWLLVGSTTRSASFSDALVGSAVDERWQLQTPKASAKENSTGLTLVPNADGAAAVTQAADATTTTLTVRVAHPQRLASGAQAGLALYLDDGDWLTLTVNGAGTVSLCASAWWQAVPCTTLKQQLGARDTALWLKLTRTSGTFAAQASRDGITWQPVGQWKPAAPETVATTANAASVVTPSPSPSATASPTATASPDAAKAPDAEVAPLAFTSVGLLVTGDGMRKSWPSFTDFTLTGAN